MNVKFPAHQQPNCWCEPCICLHHLWRLFLNNECTAIYKQIFKKLMFMFNSRHGAEVQQPLCIYIPGRTTDTYSTASFSVSELLWYHSTTTQTMTKPWMPARHEVSIRSYNVKRKVLTSALLRFKSSRMRSCVTGYVLVGMQYLMLQRIKMSSSEGYNSPRQSKFICLTKQINELQTSEIWRMTRCNDPQNLNFHDHQIMALWVTKTLFFSEASMYLIHNSQFSSTYHSNSIICVNFPLFQIFLSLVPKSIIPQKILNMGCMIILTPTL